ncbi:hypothetical protein ABE073_04470 [Lederbergia citrisecunda]
MITVLGFDHYGNARAVEAKGNKEEVKLILEGKGWTNLIIVEE